MSRIFGYIPLKVIELLNMHRVLGPCVLDVSHLGTLRVLNDGIFLISLSWSVHAAKDS
jgi:hypothetical protein